MDVDIGKVPEPHQLSPTSEPASIPTLDGWIESLMNCKQLAENDVQRLCDRVRFPWRDLVARNRFYRLITRQFIGARSFAGRVERAASGMSVGTKV